MRTGDLEEIIRSSAIELVSGSYNMYRLSPTAKIPVAAIASFRDATELTVVADSLTTTTDPQFAQRPKEGPFVIIRILVSAPFVATGFLAAVTTAIADRGLNLLLWSTFSYDYVLIRADAQEEAIDALRSRGFLWRASQ